MHKSMLVFARLLASDRVDGDIRSQKTRELPMLKNFRRTGSGTTLSAAGNVQAWGAVAGSSGALSGMLKASAIPEFGRPLRFAIT